MVTSASLLVSVLIAACGGSTSQPLSTNGGVALASTAPSAPAVGSVAPAGPSSTPTSSSADVVPSFAPDACATLVTKAEIEAAVAGTVGKLELNGKSDAPIGIPPYGGSLCWYPITAGRFVQLTVGVAPDAASLASAVATYKAKNPGTDVSGLGASAYSSDDGLIVVDGARFLHVTIFSTALDSAASDAAQVALAKKILERW